MQGKDVRSIPQSRPGSASGYELQCLRLMVYLDLTELLRSEREIHECIRIYIYIYVYIYVRVCIHKQEGLTLKGSVPQAPRRA